MQVYFASQASYVSRDLEVAFNFLASPSSIDELTLTHKILTNAITHQIIIAIKQSNNNNINHGPQYNNRRVPHAPHSVEYSLLRMGIHHFSKSTLPLRDTISFFFHSTRRFFHFYRGRRSIGNYCTKDCCLW